MRYQTLGQAGLAVAVVGLLSGCTGSDEAPAASFPVASPPPASSPVASPPAVSSPVASPPAVEKLPAGEIQQPPALEEGWEGVLTDVTLSSCPITAGQVTAEGTVLNSADEVRDISILISWNAPDSTDSLMQLAVTEEDVAAGETVTWTVSGELPSDAGQCVVLARSGALAEGG